MEFSVALNVILSGIIFIILGGAYALHKEVKMLKVFTCYIFGFAEEISGKTEKEIKKEFTVFMHKTDKDFKIKFAEEEE